MYTHTHTHTQRERERLTERDRETERGERNFLISFTYLKYVLYVLELSLVGSPLNKDYKHYFKVI
jgi:hypothetical protein